MAPIKVLCPPSGFAKLSKRILRQSQPLEPQELPAPEIALAGYSAVVAGDELSGWSLPFSYPHALQALEGELQLCPNNGKMPNYEGFLPKDDGYYRYDQPHSLHGGPDVQVYCRTCGYHKDLSSQGISRSLGLLRHPQVEYQPSSSDPVYLHYAEWNSTRQILCLPWSSDPESQSSGQFIVWLGGDDHKHYLPNALPRFVADNNRCRLLWIPD